MMEEELVSNNGLKLPEPNQKQKECIYNTQYGKYLVVAGPGTGKTFTVTRKIKHLIEDAGVEPEKILCLTFSSTAAREMKTKIGDDYAVDVFTYHEFCLNIIQDFPSEFDIIEPQVASDTVKRNIVNECIEELHKQGKLVAYNNEKENPYKFSIEISIGIDEIKKNRLTAEQIKYNLENNPMWLPRLSSIPAVLDMKYRDLEELQHEQDVIHNPKNERSKEITQLKNGIKTEIAELEKEAEKIQTKSSKIGELIQLYNLYNQKLHDKYGYIDFYDMIDMVLKRFEEENSRLLHEIANRYEYILVDEYQDTNKSQNDIVFALSKFCRNIFVVGDDDQIIYTFQGANIDTLENYMDNFPEASPIVLKENNRSTKTILEVSKVLADLQDDFADYMQDNYKKNYSQKKLRLCSKDKFQEKLPSADRIEPKKLICPESSKMFGKDAAVEYYTFENKEQERNYIVNKIKEIKNTTDDLSNIAILTKSNNDLKDFETYLKINGINVEITGGKNIFDIIAVDVLITYMQFLINPTLYSDKILAYMALDVFGIAPKDYKILYEYKSRYRSLVDNVNRLLDTGYDENELRDRLSWLLQKKDVTNLQEEIEGILTNKTISLEDSASLKNFIDTYKYLKEFVSSEKNLTKSIIEIGNKTNLFKRYIEEDINKVENIKGIKKLINEAENYTIQYKDASVFTQFVEYLSNSIDNGIAIRLEQEETPLNAIQLSTYHASKGREFEYVFMPYLTDKKFEKNAQEKKDHPIPLNFPEDATYEDLTERLEQERFLDYVKVLYVAMTRAKRVLVLSNTETTGVGKQTCSWFISRVVNNQKLIDEGYITAPEKDEYDAPEKPLLYSDYDYDQEFLEYTKNHIQKSFSASSLNTYRTCPKQYFYRYVLGWNFDFQNKDNLYFGNAVHKALEFAILYWNEKKVYPKDWQAYRVFLKTIKSSAHSNPSAAIKTARNFIFGKDKFYKKFTNLYDGEFKILESKAEEKLLYTYENIKFDGFIDRVDKIQDGSGKISYVIYDYKTGTKAEGLTAGGAYSNYYHQIAFYKYLFEKIHPEARVSKLCFLYPLLEDSVIVPASLKDAKIDSAADDVAAKFIQIAKDIRDLKFDCAKKCDEYCPYLSLCKMPISKEKELNE